MANILHITRRIDCRRIDPFAVLRIFAQTNEPCFLLEGFEEWDGTSPYSLLGLSPREIVNISPFENLKNKFRIVSTLPSGKGEIPFRGGLIGYVSYEAAQFFEPALVPWVKPLGPKNFSKLMVFDVIVGVSHEKDHLIFSGTIFLDVEEKSEGEKRLNLEFDKLENLIFRGTRDKKIETPSIDRTAALKINTEKLPLTHDLGPEIHRQGVQIIKEHIRGGDIFQCVFSDKFNIQLDVKPWDVYEILRVTNPSPFMFYLQMGTETLFGASPERLVKVDRGIIETNPIAGTRPRGLTPAQDRQREKQLLQSPKEKAEHLMLVDLGRNDVGRVSIPGTVKVEEFMTIKKFSDVMHMISKVKGKLQEHFSAWDVLASAFPAGTLSGAPKIKAMEIISKLEKAPRHFYGGAVVKYGFDGSLDSCISIRCAHFQNGVYTFQAGGGVVADSTAKKEYEEILAKSRAIRRALSVASMGL